MMKRTTIIAKLNWILPFRREGFYVVDAHATVFCEARNYDIADALVKMLNSQG